MQTHLHNLSILHITSLISTYPMYICPTCIYPTSTYLTPTSRNRTFPQEASISHIYICLMCIFPIRTFRIFRNGHNPRRPQERRRPTCREVNRGKQGIPLRHLFPRTHEAWSRALKC